MKDHITVEGHDGAFAAYIARPKTVPAPEKDNVRSRLCSIVVEAGSEL